jgi:hypothetical protein
LITAGGVTFAETKSLAAASGVFWPSAVCPRHLRRQTAHPIEDEAEQHQRGHSRRRRLRHHLRDRRARDQPTSAGFGGVGC